MANKEDSMKVFIADDSKVLRERIKEMLSDFPDVEVIGEAVDGREAIDNIRRLRPELVILDVRMPHINGISVLEKIKRLKPSPRVIVMTAYPYPQYRQKCVELGADFFFTKSDEFEKVMEVIQNLLAEAFRR
jgi:DNA-binding NarL/FixJ family response regulator